MSGEGPSLLKRVARGLAAVKATTGSESLAESLPVAIGEGVARPVIERRRKRGDGTERFVLTLPFGEGEVRIDLKPAEYEALTREMVRFWNEQGQKASGE
jgi:hypothetical protein